MGWTQTVAVERTADGRIDKKAECDNLYSYGAPERGAQVLRSTVIGNVYYAAVHAWDTKTGKDEVFAAICPVKILRYEYENFGYRMMDETEGPRECACPTYILNLLTPTTNEHALAWRQRCLEYHEKQNIKNLAPGSEVDVSFPVDICWPGSQYTLKTGEHAVFVKQKPRNQKQLWRLHPASCHAPAPVYALIAQADLINNTETLKIIKEVNYEQNDHSYRGKVQLLSGRTECPHQEVSAETQILYESREREL